MTATPPLNAALQDVIGLEGAALFRAVRRLSDHLTAPLSTEDQQVQSMPDVSPTKWHLAHVTWFFERFILKPHLVGYREFDPGFDFLFNSYYHTVGTMHARPNRGLLTRPSLERVWAYRRHVDASMVSLLESGVDAERVAFLTRIGLNHEQQHQELMLMDIKHVMSCSPFPEAVYPNAPVSQPEATEQRWVAFDGGLVDIGHAGEGFAFDNETPRHAVYLRPFELADRVVTNGEYLAFMEAGGYDEVTHWLSNGWAHIKAEGWQHPLYWRQDGAGGWLEYTLGGLKPLDRSAPVRHVSYYEADAFARWAGVRLPLEAEWEHAAASVSGDGNTLTPVEPMVAPEPRAAVAGKGLRQMIGDVWEWTASPYTAYPGFRPLEGSLGEYNGKFMCDQWVLRGGCAATPPGHVRATYRNFFPSDARWAFSGIRLARDV